MQGTATTEEPEFLEAYNLSVVQVGGCVWLCVAVCNVVHLLL